MEMGLVSIRMSNRFVCQNRIAYRCLVHGAQLLAGVLRFVNIKYEMIDNICRALEFQLQFDLFQ